MEEQNNDLFFNSVDESFTMSPDFGEEQKWLEFYSSIQAKMSPTKAEIQEAETQGYLMKMRANKDYSRYYCVFINGSFYFYKNKKDCKAGRIENSLQITNWYLVANCITVGDFQEFQLILARKNKILYLSTGDKKVFRIFTDGLSKFVIRLNLEKNYKSIGSAHSTIKKEFIFLKNEFKNKRTIGQFIDKSELSADSSISWLIFQFEMLRKITHPNILSLHQVYEEKNCFVMVYEEWRISSEAVTLNFLLKASIKLEEIVSLKIAESLLSAVEHLHNTEQILHNYIREENVLITSLEDDIDIKLFNFKHAQRVSSNKRIAKDKFDGYLSPELIAFDSLAVTTALDLYGIGVLLLRMTTGITYEALKKNKFRVSPIWIHNLSPELIQLVMGLVEPNPLKRMTRKEAALIVGERLDCLFKNSSKDILLTSNRLKAQIKVIGKMALNLTFQGGQKLNNFLMGDPIAHGNRLASEEDENQSSIMNIDHLLENQKKPQISHMSSIIMPSIIPEHESFTEENGILRRDQSLSNYRSRQFHGDYLQASVSGGSQFSENRVSLSEKSFGDCEKCDETFLKIDPFDLLSWKMEELRRSEKACTKKFFQWKKTEEDICSKKHKDSA